MATFRRKCIHPRPFDDDDATRCDVHRIGVYSLGRGKEGVDPVRVREKERERKNSRGLLAETRDDVPWIDPRTVMGCDRSRETNETNRREEEATCARGG